MPEEKIADIEPMVCLSPEHEPANMVLREPGTYRHTCPSCGKTVTFTVPMIIC